jgi:hypothetical protein
VKGSFAVVAAALALRLVLAGSAGAGSGASWTDGSTEAAGSADISTVSVDNQPGAHTITFKVQIANMPTITEDNAAVGIYLDADDNAQTGDQAGFECVFGLDNGGWYFGTWNGSSFADSGADESAFHVTYENGLMTMTTDTGECNLGPKIAFFVLSFRGADPQNPVTDAAPDNDVYEYTLSTTPPTATSFAVQSFPAHPRHGAAFMVSAFGARFSDGTAAAFVGMHCTATLAGHHLAGHGIGGCTFTVPKPAKGKRLAVVVAGKGRTTGAAYHHTFVYTVR